MFNQIRRLDCLVGRMVYFIFCLFGIGSEKKNQIFAGRVKKIICIKLWGLGNLTIIYPLLYRIKEKFTQARLIFITFDLNKGFLEGNQAIDRIVYFKFTDNPLLIAWRLVRLLMTLKRESFDLVINFETFNHTSALFSYLTGASARIGLYTKYEKIFYNYPSYHEKSAHISQLFLNLLKPLGLNSEYGYFNYQGLNKEREKIESLLSYLKIKEFICFHVGTSNNFKGKRYKESNFAKLADLLIDKYGMPIIFSGTENEMGLVRDTAKLVSFKDKIFNLAGKLTFGEFVELLKKTTLFVSVDTGPVHIAASLGVNLAVFYGPTSPKRYKPLNENSQVFYKNMNCSPCVGIDYINKRCKNDFACLDFSPQEVFSKISEKFFHAEKD